MSAPVSPSNLSTLIVIGVFAVLIGIRLWRAAREQRFQPTTMWIAPGIFAAITLAWAIADRFTTPLDVVLLIASLAVGGAIGWYQGTHTSIRYDHAIHAMFVKISPIGSMIWIAVLALRFGVRYVTGGLATVPADPAGSAHTLTANRPADLLGMLLLFVALGVIVGLRAYLQRAYSLERASL